MKGYKLVQGDGLIGNCLACAFVDKQKLFCTKRDEGLRYTFPCVEEAPDARAYYYFVKEPLKINKLIDIL